MTSAREPKFLRSCTFVWLALLLLTVVTYVIGELDAGGSGVMLAVLAIAALKVQMVASFFMGLRRTRWLWRGIVLGWLLLVIGLISFAYLTAVR